MPEQKRALRQKILKICRDIPQEVLQEASGQITRRVMAQAAQMQPGSVFCYVSYRSEIKTQELLQALHEAGWRVYVPYVAGQRMQAVRWTPDTPMVLNQWGIPEPAVREAPDEPLTLAILPGVAFGKDGTRLGYGGGYYDRFLAEHPCRRIGICGSWQLLDSVPTEPHDLTADGILCENQEIIFTTTEIYPKI